MSETSGRSRLPPWSLGPAPPWSFGPVPPWSFGPARPTAQLSRRRPRPPQGLNRTAAGDTRGYAMCNETAWTISHAVRRAASHQLRLQHHQLQSRHRGLGLRLQLSTLSTHRMGTLWLGFGSALWLRISLWALSSRSGIDIES